MLRGLLKLLFWVVLGVLVYNYFFGTAPEKESSKRIFGEVRNLALSIKDLLQSEREKFDAGKYDNAVDKLDSLLVKLRSQAENNGDLLKRIKEIEARKEQLKRQIDKTRNTPNSRGESDDLEKTSIKREFNQLMNDTERLMQDMEQTGQ